MGQSPRLHIYYMYIYYYVLVKREKTFCYDNRSFVVFFVQN